MNKPVLIAYVGCMFTYCLLGVLFVSFKEQKCLVATFLLLGNYEVFIFPGLQFVKTCQLCCVSLVLGGEKKQGELLGILILFSEMI